MKLHTGKSCPICDKYRAMAIGADDEGMKYADRAKNLEDVLRSIEWSGVRIDESGDIWPICPCCEELKDDGVHLLDCKLAAALGRPEQAVPEKRSQMAKPMTAEEVAYLRTELDGPAWGASKRHDALRLLATLDALDTQHLKDMAKVMDQCEEQNARLRTRSEKFAKDMRGALAKLQGSIMDTESNAARYAEALREIAAHNEALLPDGGSVFVKILARAALASAPVAQQEGKR